MSHTRPRFYDAADIRETESGWSLVLDGAPVKTPAGSALVLPTRALAEAVAAEWQAQDENIDPDSMPLTRLANTAIDRVAADPAALSAIIAAYGETDLLCYRAPEPPELTAAETQEWAPWLDWARTRFGVELTVAHGITPVEQRRDDLETLARAVEELSPWELTALSEIVTLTGSLILGLAVSEGALTETEAWRLSQLDEEHQAERWGRDHEAESRRQQRCEAVIAAARFLALCRS